MYQNDYNINNNRSAHLTSHMFVKGHFEKKYICSKLVYISHAFCFYFDAFDVRLNMIVSLYLSINRNGKVTVQWFEMHVFVGRYFTNLVNSWYMYYGNVCINYQLWVLYVSQLTFYSRRWINAWIVKLKVLKFK